MDLLKDNLKKLYLKFLIPSFGSAMVMSIYTLAFATLGIVTVILWLIYGMGINLLTSYYLQSVLSVKKSLCISLLRNIILSSIGILTFPLMFGADSLWGVMLVVEAIVFVVSMCFVMKKN